jgi:hypothetical protein
MIDLDQRASFGNDAASHSRSESRSTSLNRASFGPAETRLSLGVDREGKTVLDPL